MLTKLTIASAVFAATAMSTNVQAKEISLQEFVGHVVSTAVSVTQKEVRQNVQQAVASTTYSVFNTPGASVTITDMAAKPAQKEQQDDATKKQAE
ncbi:hypothetical protein [Lacimicrobium sp. SS2-24]|uniref:hypothetical protein n=1 Tax=Lacimicrobium sp. SS2-24 TaxID=2005569 RepID=UPI000B4B3D3F|nr:hypothetical protein [Lacimicrobium sp. SS2-24]